MQMNDQRAQKLKRVERFGFGRIARLLVANVISATAGVARIRNVVRIRDKIVPGWRCGRIAYEQRICKGVSVWVLGVVRANHPELGCVATRNMVVRVGIWMRDACTRVTSDRVRFALATHDAAVIFGVGGRFDD